MLKAVRTAMLFVLATSSFADFWNSQSTGQGAFAFLENFESPRSLSVAKTNVASPAADPSLVFLNPALLLPSRYQFQSYASWQLGAQGTDQGFFALNTRYHLWLFQTTMCYLQNGTIAGMDEEGNASGINYLPSAWQMALTATFPAEDFRFGSSIKFIQEHLSNESQDQNAFAIAWDWGIQWSVHPRLSLGFTAKNLGLQLRAYTQEGVNHLPLNSSFTFGGTLRNFITRRLNLLFSSEVSRYNPPVVALGAEYSIFSWFQLRGGIARYTEEIKDRLSMFFPDVEDVQGQWVLGNLGASIILERYSLDYSLEILDYQPMLSHQLGIRYSF